MALHLTPSVSVPPWDAHTLRAQLMSPHPMQRILALHALEGEASEATAVQQAASRFAARGIPYYAPDDAHYRAWVDKAVSLWLRLHAGLAPATALAIARRGRVHGAALSHRR